MPSGMKCCKCEAVNHTIHFVDVRSGAHTNTIESTWRHVKAFLNPNNRMGDNIYHLAHNMFPAGCLSENADQFIKFVIVVASMDWCATPTLDYSKAAK